MKEIYLEMKDVVKFNKRKVITIEDIATVYAEERLKNQVLKVPIAEGKYEREVIKALDVIQMLKQNFLFITVNNIGVTETLVIFDDKKENKPFTIAKVVIGSLITFLGSFVAIMTFQTDVSLADTLKHIYTVLVGSENIKPYAIQIPYSLGIAIGSITFFMKFKNKSITPLEVEIDKYEKDIKTSETKKLESEGK